MRNTEEIVTVDELKGLLEQSRRPRAYVGYETSGKVHLGHMLTANKLLDLQKVGFDVVVLLADLHAFLNEKGTLEEVRKSPTTTGTALWLSALIRRGLSSFTAQTISSSRNTCSRSCRWPEIQL